MTQQKHRSLSTRMRQSTIRFRKHTRKDGDNIDVEELSGQDTKSVFLSGVDLINELDDLLRGESGAFDVDDVSRVVFQMKRHFNKLSPVEDVQPGVVELGVGLRDQQTPSPTAFVQRSTLEESTSHVEGMGSPRSTTNSAEASSVGVVKAAANEGENNSGGGDVNNSGTGDVNNSPSGASATERHLPEHTSSDSTTSESAARRTEAVLPSSKPTPTKPQTAHDFGTPTDTRFCDAKREERFQGPCFTTHGDVDDVVPWFVQRSHSLRLKKVSEELIHELAV